jgi:opacity protein-like surface antigen
MKQKIILKSLLIAGVASLGFASLVRAADPSLTAPVVASDSLGLLGQTYAGLTYSYINLDNAPVNAASYGFEYNQPLNPGFDAVFNYDWSQSGPFAGDRAHGQSLDAALRAFSSSYSWGKPYVEAGVGYEWMKYAGAKDNSFAWLAGAGVEFQATTALTITPYLRYVKTNGFEDHNTVNYGVKANYWITRQWAVTGAISRDDDQDMTYKVGVNVRF